jgi:hypothetical protein
MSNKAETTAYEMGDEEVGALHCLGMCADWAGHPACDGEHGLQQFLVDCAEGLRWQRDEIGRLRRGWLRVIQMENSCPATGGGCLAKRCGCVAEMEMLAGEADKIA